EGWQGHAGPGQVAPRHRHVLFLFALRHLGRVEADRGLPLIGGDRILPHSRAGSNAGPFHIARQVTLRRNNAKGPATGPPPHPSAPKGPSKLQSSMDRQRRRKPARAHPVLEDDPMASMDFLNTAAPVKAPLVRNIPAAEKPTLIGLSREDMGRALVEKGVAERQVKMRVSQLWHWLYVHGV